MLLDDRLNSQPPAWRIGSNDGTKPSIDFHITETVSVSQHHATVSGIYFYFYFLYLVYENTILDHLSKAK